MKPTTAVILSASPQTQPARKLRKTASLALRQRRLYGRVRRNNTGKELDSETGLYYYGARYLDPRVSRWISGDPALGEYVPSAPVSDEARKRNGNLPGMGGVFNYVNLHVYHYAGNNPVKYIDPDGHYLRDQRNGIIIWTGTGYESMRNIKWGWFGNIADNGCGVIAAYNVLYSKNPNTNFFTVKDGLAKKGGVLLRIGSVGVDPGGLASYMETKFTNVEVYGPGMNGSDTGIIGQVDAVIVLVAWDDPLENGMHYFAGIPKDSSDSSEFFFYNSGVTGVKDYEAISLEQLYEKINNMGATPLCLLTVQGKKEDW